jgi:hypothetical protein
MSKERDFGQAELGLVKEREQMDALSTSRLHTPKGGVDICLRLAVFKDRVSVSFMP